jgi:hypothetical protein
MGSWKERRASHNSHLASGLPSWDFDRETRFSNFTAGGKWAFSSWTKTRVFQSPHQASKYGNRCFVGGIGGSSKGEFFD